MGEEVASPLLFLWTLPLARQQPEVPTGKHYSVRSWSPAASQAPANNQSPAESWAPAANWQPPGMNWKRIEPGAHNHRLPLWHPSSPQTRFSLIFCSLGQMLQSRCKMERAESDWLLAIELHRIELCYGGRYRYYKL